MGSFARGRNLIARLRDLGPLDAELTVDELMRVWTILTSGVTIQQLANAPEEPFEKGSFTTTLSQHVEMYRTPYAPRHTANKRNTA